jgi:hypothetical protein
MGNAHTITAVSYKHISIFRSEAYALVARLDTFPDGFLFGLLFDLEDGGDMFLRNVG